MEVLRPNTGAVAAKVIDGEAIIMNLTNGAYYSMDGVGAAIWETIERGSTREDMRTVVAARYTVEPTQAAADIDRLVGELLSEGLIIAATDASRAAQLVLPSSDALHPYGSPTLNKYTEMADLLALDPPMPALGELPGDRTSAS